MRVEFDGLREAVAWLKRAPRKMKRAMAAYTNNQAVWMRELIIQSIQSEMTLRDTRFVRGSVTYKKGSLSGNPPFKASAGSIERDRFSGWVEQEVGGNTKRKRDVQLPARRGQWKKKAVPSSRLKPGNKFHTAQTVVGSNNVVGMMRALSRRRDKRKFIIYPGQHPKFPRGGLYEFVGRATKTGYRRIRVVQSFGGSRPRRRLWMTGAVGDYCRRVRPQHEWAKALRFVFG